MTRLFKSRWDTIGASEEDLASQWGAKSTVWSRVKIPGLPFKTIINTILWKTEKSVPPIAQNIGLLLVQMKRFLWDKRKGWIRQKQISGRFMLDSGMLYDLQIRNIFVPQVGQVP